MALYKRNGVWWYHFVFNGRHVQKSTKVKNKRDAADIQAAYRTKLAKGEVGIEEPKPPKQVPTFAQAMKDFLDWSEQEHAAHPNTHRRYQISSKALLRHFGNAAIDTITSDDVEKVKTSRAKQKKLAPGKKAKRVGKLASKQLRPATVNRELACLKHLFNRNEATVPKNPVKGVKFLAEDNEQTRVLSADEEKLYLLAAS